MPLLPPLRSRSPVPGPRTRELPRKSGPSSSSCRPGRAASLRLKGATFGQQQREAKKVVSSVREEHESVVRGLLPSLKRHSETRASVCGSLQRERSGSIPWQKRRRVSAASVEAPRAGGVDGDDQGSTLDVGPASESREEHLRRHEGGRRDCPRCRFYVLGADWMRNYGGAQDPRTSHPTKVIWLQERPPRYGGGWGLGCVFCASAACLQRDTPVAQPHRHNVKSAIDVDAAHCQGEHKRTTPSKSHAGPRFHTKWARHEISYSHLQSEHIRKHSFSQAHKLSTARYFAPDVPVKVLLQRTQEDEELLQGAVPQLEDYLRVWRICREPQSWLSAEHSLATDQYISQGRAPNAKRRALQSIAAIEREVTRERKRDCIRACTYISYVWDERDGHLLLRFRCDVPPWSHAKCRVGSAEAKDQCKIAWGRSLAADINEEEAMKLCHASGVIGISRMYYEKTLEELTDKGAEQMVNDVVSLLRSFCVPLGGSLDANLFDAMKSKCIGVAVDGAALKAANLFKEKHAMHIICLCRDASHAIRIACHQPLTRTGGFQKQYDELFQKKGALMKSIDFSNKQKAMLEACQKHVVDIDGHQGGGLTKIMRNLSHAPQRWESMAAPYRIYCCIFKAIAMLLAAVVDSDQDRDLRMACLQTFGGNAFSY